MADTKNNTDNRAGGFSDMELALMKERAKELQAEDRVNKNKEIGEKDVNDAINQMTEEDGILARQVDAIVKASAPDLLPRLWYGMPAYTKDGKVICFFQSSSKFKVRYCTFGFQPEAMIDDGNMWPVAYALKQITEIEETKIAALIKQAIAS